MFISAKHMTYESTLMKKTRLIFIFLWFCLINLVMQNSYGQSTPVLIIPQHEFTICQGDTAIVAITIISETDVFLEYEFEGVIYTVISTSEDITLKLTNEGIYYIVRYGDEHEIVDDVNDSIMVALFPAPSVYFTGGGLVCNNDEFIPLTANFEGELPFILTCLINGEPDTIIVNGYTYTFPVDEPIFVETQSLEDDNCRHDLTVYGEFEIINIPQPAIEGEIIFCELDQTTYTAEQDNFAAEWLIPEGADYVEGIDGDGSFINVRWNEPGEHEVWLRLIDEESECASEWTILHVTVYETPDAIELIDTTICFELEEFLFIEIQSNPEEVITWPELGITGNALEIYSAGSYAFIQSNIYGCSDTGTVVVSNNCVPEIHIPDAFTPNEDGINDYLEIFGLYDEIELTIYSPSGILLYRMTTDDPPWDGTKDGNKVPSGSYNWHVTYHGRDGVPRNRSGIVTIIR